MKNKQLEIHDTGCGMDEEAVRKAFDPYFTTKKKEDGTGLGLAIVQAIVDEHDGFLELSSKPGKGSSFYLYFPTVRKQDDEERENIGEQPVKSRKMSSRPLQVLKKSMKMLHKPQPQPNRLQRILQWWIRHPRQRPTTVNK